MRPPSPCRSTFNPFSVDSPPPSSSKYTTLETLTSSAPGSGLYHVLNLPHRESSSERWQQLLNVPSSNHRPWVYNPVVGIMHSPPDGCSICNAYVNHMMVAMNGDDPSFLQAVEARKESQDTFFMDGFGEGMRHQRNNDLQLNEDIEYLRAQLDLATNVFEEKEAENERLRKENDRLRQQVASLGEAQSLQALSNPIDTLPSRSSPSTSAIVGPGSYGSSTGSSMEVQRRISQDIGLNSSWFPRNTEPHEIDNLVKPPPSSYALAVSHHFPKTHASSDAPRLPMKPHPVMPVTPAKIEPYLPATSRNQHDKAKAKYPRTLKDLKDLMELAREPTNDGMAALSIVKNFCSRAHSTPREQKTFMQRWILMNWKNPYATSSTTSTPAIDAKPNPRIDDPVDVWYEYLCTHSHSWPKGVRKDTLDRPILSDLIANRAVARMRPSEPAASRNDFIAHVTDMFATPGMYRRLLELGKLIVAAEVSYKLFTGPISIDTIVRHFAESGITPADATKHFEPWAKHYKEC